MARVKMTASEGMLLTNGEAYGRVVLLGDSDSPDSWQEITEEEAQHRMKAKEEAYETDLY